MDLFASLKQKRELPEISNHPLAKEDDYTKELYFQLLMAISYEFGQSKEQVIFLDMLFRGLGLADLDKYKKKALEIKEDFFDEIIKVLKNEKTSEMLLVDAIILANIDHGFDEDRINILDKMFGLFEVPEKKSKHIIDKAKYIIENLDFDEFCIYPEVAENFITDTQIIDKGIHITGRKIYYECEFDIREEGSIIFKRGKIVFIRCKFMFYTKVGVEFKNLDEVIFTETEFLPPIEFINCQSIHISKSDINNSISFTDCNKVEFVENSLHSEISFTGSMDNVTFNDLTLTRLISFSDGTINSLNFIGIHAVNPLDRIIFRFQELYVENMVIENSKMAIVDCILDFEDYYLKKITVQNNKMYSKYFMDSDSASCDFMECKNNLMIFTRGLFDSSFRRPSISRGILSNNRMFFYCELENELENELEKHDSLELENNTFTFFREEEINEILEEEGMPYLDGLVKRPSVGRTRRAYRVHPVGGGGTN